MHHIFFIIFSLLMLALYFVPLRNLTGLSFHNELYSHFLLIPLVSLYFLFLDRKEIFGAKSYSFRTGIVFIVGGMVLYGLGKVNFVGLNQNNYLSLMMFSFLICFIGGFILFYGNNAFRKAIFPLLFMIFIIPIPTLILEPLLRILVSASANTSYAVFNLLGVPVFRDGFIFELPGISIEVAKECSGIRSSLALFITSVVAGSLFLQTGWRRIVLSLSIFPITIFKNALRIVTISLLAAYVDPIFLTNHWVHRAGGKPFFIFALLVMLPVLLLLRRSERKKKEG